MSRQRLPLAFGGVDTVVAPDAVLAMQRLANAQLGTWLGMTTSLDLNHSALASLA